MLRFSSIFSMAMRRVHFSDEIQDFPPSAAAPAGPVVPPSLVERLDTIERQNRKILELVREVLDEQRHLKEQFVQLNDCFNILSSEDLAGVKHSVDSLQETVQRLIAGRGEETAERQGEFVSGERHGGFADESGPQAGSSPAFGGETSQSSERRVATVRGSARREVTEEMRPLPGPGHRGMWSRFDDGGYVGRGRGFFRGRGGSSRS